MALSSGYAEQVCLVGKPYYIIFSMIHKVIYSFTTRNCKTIASNFARAIIFVNGHMITKVLLPCLFINCYENYNPQKFGAKKAMTKKCNWGPMG